MKSDLLVVDLDYHEVVVLIKTRGSEAASLVDIATTTLPGCPADEVMNALLRFGSFIDVIVTGKTTLTS